MERALRIEKDGLTARWLSEGDGGGFSFVVHGFSSFSASISEGRGFWLGRMKKKREMGLWRDSNGEDGREREMDLKRNKSGNTLEEAN